MTPPPRKGRDTPGGEARARRGKGLPGAMAAVAAAVLCCLALGAVIWLDYAAFRRDWRALLVQGLTTPQDLDSPQAQDVYHQHLASELLAELGSMAPDVLYLNDSVMGGHSTDEARTPLNELLAGQLLALRRGVTVRGLSGAGYTPLVYGRYAWLLAGAPRKPRLVIFSLNPRSLSSVWFFTQDSLYARVVRFLPLLSRRPDFRAWLAWLPGRLSGQGLEDFLASEDRPVPEREAQAYFGAHRRDTGAFGPPPPGLDAYEKGLREKFLENYTTVEVTPLHPMLRELDHAVRTLVQAGMRVLVYTTPVDAAEGDRLAGPAFTQTLRRDLAAVGDVARAAGAHYLDLSELLGSSLFVDRDQACEHLSLAGRREVARALALKAERLLDRPGQGAPGGES